MKVLLDTNALLWAAYRPGSLKPRAFDAFMNADHVGVSMVSLWEIGLKMSGKGFGSLGVPDDWNVKLLEWMEAQHFELMVPSVQDCRLIQDLPLHHRDPFDRMLIAQAMHAGLQVISSDRCFDDYGVKRIG